MPDSMMVQVAMLHSSAEPVSRRCWVLSMSRYLTHCSCCCWCFEVKGRAARRPWRHRPAWNASPDLRRANGRRTQVFPSIVHVTLTARLQVCNALTARESWLSTSTMSVRTGWGADEEGRRGLREEVPTSHPREV